MYSLNRDSQLAQAGLWVILAAVVISLLAVPTYTPRAVAAAGQSYSSSRAATPAACPPNCYDIGGQVFVDNDGDGLYTTGTDIPLANVTIDLAGPVISTTVSNNRTNNNYQFKTLPTGTYTVTLDMATLPAGYDPVTPTELVVILASQDAWGNDFGVGVASTTSTPTFTPTPTDTPSPTPTNTPPTNIGHDIVFVQPQPELDGGGTVNSDVWIMDADGSNQTQLTTFSEEDRWPVLSPDNSQIAYMSRRDGLMQLWVMNSDGTSPVQLPVGGNTQRLDWSPDGTEIAITNDTEDWWEIWIIGADGSNLHRITTTGPAAGNPTWSPDAQKIAYNVNPSAGYQDLYTVNSDGTGASVLVSASGTGYSQDMPAWSPDGTQIATIRWPVTSSGPYDLWVMNADGTNGQVLVNDLDPPHVSRLSWSGDSNWIVFGKEGQIWRVRRGGTEPTQITFNSGWEADTNVSGFGLPITPTPTATPNLTETPTATSTPPLPPAISPDIVFVRPEPAPDGSVNSDVWGMDADGSNQVQLTTYSEEETWPALSPDGSKVVYTSRQGASQTLWMMNSDGTDASEFLAIGNIHYPVWSPDGSKLAFESDAVDFWEIWTADADGSNPLRLTTTAGPSGAPSWAPVGDKLVFVQNNSLATTWDLYLVNSDGTGQTLLVSASATGYSNNDPAWSPDGIQIATVHWPAGGVTGPYDLWLMNADGTNGHVLVQDIEPAPSNRLAWSTDSNWITFSKGSQIWRVRRDGTDLTQITLNNGWQAYTNVSGFEGGGTVTPTPTATTTATPAPTTAHLIAFVKPQPALDGSGSVNSDIWVMDGDASNPTQITSFSGEDRWPALSPDGSKLAYMSRQNGLMQLWVANSDGSCKHQLPVGGNTQRLAWSPDGRQLAITNDTEEWWEIWTINADGSNLQRLTTTSSAAGNPAWSPDGQSIIYIVDSDIYLVNSDGTGAAMLVSSSSTGYSHSMPTWSPDGTQMAVIRSPISSTTGPYDLWVINADGTGGNLIVPGVEHPHLNRLSWSSDGKLVFTQGGQAWSIRGDGGELTQITTTGGWEPDINRGELDTDNRFSCIYMPLMQLGKPRGIYGTVTENGVPAVGAFLELRWYDGATWSTRASAYTGIDGSYSFLDMPSLNPSERYYVRYSNPENFTSRLAAWFTQEILIYTFGAEVHIGDFDISNIALLEPDPGAFVPLPQLFQWVARSAVPSDSYEFNLFDPYGTAYFYTDPPLGYVGTYTLNGLPPGFGTGIPYAWYIGVYSPDGGYGLSYYAYFVTFTSTGFRVTAAERSSDLAKFSDRYEHILHLKIGPPSQRRPVIAK